MIIDIPEINGLYLLTDIFTLEEDELYMTIIKNLSKDEINNCFQVHPALEFGWKFLPIMQRSEKDFLGKYPDWLLNIWTKVYENLLQTNFPVDYPDNVLINKYKIGEGCNAHVDDIKFWNNWVIGVSFGSGATMRFKRIKKDEDFKYFKQYDIYIPKGSVYILLNDARYEYTHEILPLKEDNIFNQIVKREERISLTFRTIHNDYLNNELRNKHL